jgi:hypothetical protein
MITKAELIKKIDEAIITEESAMGIYDHHLKAILPRSGLSEETRSEIMRNLNTLSDESAKHKKLLLSLKNEIEKEERNVF